MAIKYSESCLFFVDNIIDKLLTNLLTVKKKSISFGAMYKYVQMNMKTSSILSHIQIFYFYLKVAKFFDMYFLIANVISPKFYSSGKLGALRIESRIIFNVIKKINSKYEITSIYTYFWLFLRFLLFISLFIILLLL